MDKTKETLYFTPAPSNDNFVMGRSGMQMGGQRYLMVRRLKDGRIKCKKESANDTALVSEKVTHG